MGRNGQRERERESEREREREREREKEHGSTDRTVRETLAFQDAKDESKRLGLFKLSGPFEVLKCFEST